MRAASVSRDIDYQDDGKTLRIRVKLPAEKCTNCGELFFGPQAARIEHAAVCRALGLLTSDEIINLRESLGLSQDEFSELTGIGRATISRWERGRLLQNKAMDHYLRLVKKSKNNLKYLREIAHAK
ncbi:MAG: type II toxin-antitoxin system MqsA family antitoxin [Gemmataceae bacterium]|nr:type II toxin-antitoxin system MqsA family antitoxin [Gemmataceae bacterium]MCI0739083.1 type II toxin-antitoxin system MqsA family antitoxin [Gemmataceae bacterium]